MYWRSLCLNLAIRTISWGMVVLSLYYMLHRNTTHHKSTLALESETPDGKLALQNLKILMVQHLSRSLRLADVEFSFSSRVNWSTIPCSPHQDSLCNHCQIFMIAHSSTTTPSCQTVRFLFSLQVCTTCFWTGRQSDLTFYWTMFILWSSFFVICNCSNKGAKGTSQPGRSKLYTHKLECKMWIDLLWLLAYAGLDCCCNQAYLFNIFCTCSCVSFNHDTLPYHHEADWM